jgi:bifunctional DNase/RNase
MCVIAIATEVNAPIACAEPIAAAAGAAFARLMRDASR